MSTDDWELFKRSVGLTYSVKWPPQSKQAQHALHLYNSKGLTGEYLVRGVEILSQLDDLLEEVSTNNKEYSEYLRLKEKFYGR